MRRNNGWYPAFIGEKFMAPREHPRDWLEKHDGDVLVGYVDDGPPPRRIVELHKVDDVVTFDRWQGIGSTIISLDPKGKPRLETPEPKHYDTLWNPRDPQAREWPTLKAFLKQWEAERGEFTTVAVEFLAWERGVPFRIVPGPDAVAVKEPAADKPTEGKAEP